MAVTLGGNTTIKTTNLAAWSPSTLFAAGEQGAWYDPSNINSMFQDSAATTPVTAVEQPVGLIRDLSGRGNDASQSTSASRPVLSARYNLLTKTEQFDNAAWTKEALTVSANTTETTDPLGGNTADKIIPTVVSTGHYLATATRLLPSGFTYTNSIYIKAGGYGFAGLSDATIGQAVINLSTGAVVSKDAFITTASTQDVGNGWWKVTITYTANSTRGLGVDVWSDGNKTTFAGNGTSGIYLWGASSTVSNDGVSIPYQCVNTSTDYDSNPVNFPWYLKFDGSDDFLQTSSIDFSSGDSISVSAGLRKLSDSALGVVTELSSTIASNNGTFLLSAPNSAAANYNYSSKGTAQSNNTITTYTSPISNVLVCNSVISTDTNNIYVNNGSATASATDQGTGNYGNYAMYLGRRGGSSNPYNGRLYELIVRAGSLSAAQASTIAQYLNAKDKIF